MHRPKWPKIRTFPYGWKWKALLFPQNLSRSSFSTPKSPSVHQSACLCAHFASLQECFQVFRSRYQISLFLMTTFLLWVGSSQLQISFFSIRLESQQPRSIFMYFLGHEVRWKLSYCSPQTPKEAFKLNCKEDPEKSDFLLLWVCAGKMSTFALCEVIEVPPRRQHFRYFSAYCSCEG